MSRYKIEHRDTDQEFIVEIDEAKAAEVIKQMVEFWTGWEFELELNDGDYITTFCKQLGSKLTLLTAEYLHYNVVGIREDLIECEGWYACREEFGIKLISITPFDCGNHLYEITKIEKEKP